MIIFTKHRRETLAGLAFLCNATISNIWPLLMCYIVIQATVDLRTLFGFYRNKISSTGATAQTVSFSRMPYRPIFPIWKPHQECHPPDGIHIFIFLRRTISGDTELLIWRIEKQKLYPSRAMNFLSFSRMWNHESNVLSNALSYSELNVSRYTA
jgi:hypothetical protein